MCYRALFGQSVCQIGQKAFGTDRQKANRFFGAGGASLTPPDPDPSPPGGNPDPPPPAVKAVGRTPPPGEVYQAVGRSSRARPAPLPHLGLERRAGAGPGHDPLWRTVLVDNRVQLGPPGWRVAAAVGSFTARLAHVGLIRRRNRNSKGENIPN